MHHPVELSAKIAGKASGLRAALVGRGGIFKRLVEEHVALRRLLARVAKASDDQQKREIFNLVRREILAHTKAEEREFYAELRDYERTRALAQSQLDDHERIEDLVDRLSAIPVADARWPKLLEELSSELAAHVRREENELFEEAAEIIGRVQARRIERRFLRRKHDELDSLP